MTWRGPWDGPWDGSWEGGGAVDPNLMAASLGGSGAVVATLTDGAAAAERVAGDYDGRKRRQRATFGIPQPLEPKAPVIVEMRADLAGSGAVSATGAVMRRARVIEFQRASVGRVGDIGAKTDAAAVRALWLQARRAEEARREAALAAIVERHRRLMEEDELWLMAA